LAYQNLSIWLLDVARQVPSTVQLDAFDISDKQFPHEASRPDNISFRQLDAFSQVPEELIGKYDVVHLRLWCCIVKDCNTAALIKHATQLLSRFLTLTAASFIDQ
jgi:hypothetical protein